MEHIILGILLAILLIATALVVSAIPFRKYLPIFYVCHLMDWHYVDKTEEQLYDGVSLHSHCSKCGKHVILSSRGGWF